MNYLTIEYSVLDKFKPFCVIGFCSCECGVDMYPYDSRNRPRRFLNFHQNNYIGVFLCEKSIAGP